MRARTITCVQLGLSVTVVEALPFMNLYRDLLMQRALAEVSDVFAQSDFEQSSTGLLCHAYASCLAATVQSRGFDYCTFTLVEFAVFCALAEPFMETWLHCVLELNPSWRTYTRPDSVN